MKARKDIPPNVNCEHGLTFRERTLWWSNFDKLYKLNSLPSLASQRYRISTLLERLRKTRAEMQVPRMHQVMKTCGRSAMCWRKDMYSRLVEKSKKWYLKWQGASGVERRKGPTNETLDTPSAVPKSMKPTDCLSSSLLVVVHHCPGNDSYQG